MVRARGSVEGEEGVGLVRLGGRFVEWCLGWVVWVGLWGGRGR